MRWKNYYLHLIQTFTCKLRYTKFIILLHLKQAYSKDLRKPSLESGIICIIVIFRLIFPIGNTFIQTSISACMPVSSHMKHVWYFKYCKAQFALLLIYVCTLYTLFTFTQRDFRQDLHCSGKLTWTCTLNL